MKNRFLKKKRSAGTQTGKHSQPFLVAIAIVSLLIGALSFLYIASAATNNLPPDKEKLLELDQQEIATARAKPGPPKPTYPTPPSPQPAPQLQTGIVDTHEGPFSVSDFIVRNGWQGPVGSNWELVYAGSRTNNLMNMSGPGALKIFTETGFDVKEAGTYIAPNNESALTITAVNGTLMQLRTDIGQTLTFNLQTNQYS